MSDNGIRESLSQKLMQKSPVDDVYDYQEDISPENNEKNDAKFEESK